MPSAIAVAAASSRWATPDGAQRAVVGEVAAGGDPLALDGELSRAVKACAPLVSSGEKSPSTSQYDARRNAIRSRSRSTTMRVATDCTRPADRPWRTLRHSTGETS